MSRLSRNDEKTNSALMWYLGISLVGMFAFSHIVPQDCRGNRKYPDIRNVIEPDRVNYRLEDLDGDNKPDVPVLEIDSIPYSIKKVNDKPVLFEYNSSRE